ncbi:MAG: S58 family peptidase, partial [Mesorhizobium sp.]
ITDVPGVSVGYTTLISGDGPLRVGNGPVRTGVTAILPRPVQELATPVFAGVFSQNGNGELTGTHIIEETGAFNFPVTITNTHSCGVTRDATLRWMHKVLPAALDTGWGLPVAAETYDGFLNDINGHHVSVEHVVAALDRAADAAFLEATARAEKGSIIAVVATDAPFLPHQMKRLARRVPLGIAMTGGYGYHSSGDIFLAFSTANPEAALGASGR